MKGQTKGFVLQALLMILGLVMTGSVAHALPPEGFENFTLIGRTLPTSYYSAGVGHHRPAWRKEFQDVHLFYGTPAGSNYFTFGAKASVTPSWGDRDAYFARYDFRVFESSSFAFTWMHENWRYI